MSKINKFEYSDFYNVDEMSLSEMRQAYSKLAKTANRRIRRVRESRFGEVYGTKKVSIFLRHVDRKFFPKVSTIKDNQMRAIFNQLTQYLDDETSTLTGITNRITYYYNKTRESRSFKGRESGGFRSRDIDFSNVSDEELVRLFATEEFAMLRRIVDYVILIENYTEHKKLGGTFDEFVEDMHDYLTDGLNGNKRYDNWLELYNERKEQRKLWRGNVDEKN